MSYDLRFSGALRFHDAKALRAAIRKMRDAIADEEECDSFVAPEDLKVDGATIRIETEGSCPATMWEETLAFLEILGAAAIQGSIKGYLEGELSDTVKATGKSANPKAKKPKKRRKANPSALRWAAQFGQLDEVQALLDGGTDPSAPDPSNHMLTTPLMMAAYHGKAAVVELLLSAGAAIDAQCAVGNTALFYAASNKNKRGRQRCIELLVHAGANLNIRNNGNETALQYAKDVRAFEGAEELKALSAKAPRKRTYGGKKMIPRG